MAKFVKKFEKAVQEAGYTWTPPDYSYPVESGAIWREWEGERMSFCVEEWPDGYIDYLLVTESNEKCGENPSPEFLVDTWRKLYS
jgi:hypothetical protein